MQSQRSKAELLQKGKLQVLVDAHQEGQARIAEERRRDYRGRCAKLVAQVQDATAFAERLERKNQKLKTEHATLRV